MMTIESARADPAAPAQNATSTQYDETLEEVTVVGQALPGAVIGDIPPENSLSPRDIRGYGVGSIAELLDELSLQTASGQGRGDEAPVILVNGRRISGVNEVSDLPTESILRLDILPEEVGLKYGYSAGQKVVNVILRRRFAAVTADAASGGSTEGEGERTKGDVTLTRIQGNKRLNIALSAQSQQAITEADRGIVAAADSPASDPAYRTLRPSAQTYAANVTFAVPINDKVSASTNFTATRALSQSLTGLAQLGSDGEDSEHTPLEPLDQSTQATTIHFGTALNADLPQSWRLSWIGGYDHASLATDTERVRVPLLSGVGVDEARSVSDGVNGSVLATHKLLRLPAGDALMSVSFGAQVSDNKSETMGTRAMPERKLARSSENAQVSLDLPITRKNGFGGAVGSTTANVNASATHVSDFDMLTTVGYGLNWSPVPAASLIVAMNEDRRAPTVQQLNNPVVTNVNTRVYDYATGQSVLVTSTTGGNPLLGADDRRTFKLGGTVKPFEDYDLTLTGNYSDSRTRNAVLSLTGVSPQIESAFPERFLRDDDNQLVSLDARPVNVTSQRRSNLRWGINFTQTLRAPARPMAFGRRRPGRTQAAPVEGTRAAAPPTQHAPAAAPADGRSGLPPTGSDESVDEVVVTGERPQDTDAPTFPNPYGEHRRGRFGERRDGAFEGGAGRAGGPGGGRSGFGVFNRGFGMPGIDDGAQLQFSIYHTWLLRDEVTLRNGLAPVDLLEGATLGGPPPSRHQVQMNGGVIDNGIGIRLTAQWRSSAQITDMSSGTGALSFGALATLDLRLFADLQQRLRNKTWARGMRLTLAAQNIFDAKQRVVDANGVVPLTYQPGYIDPVGRAVFFTVRKMF